MLWIMKNVRRKEEMELPLVTKDDLEKAKDEIVDRVKECIADAILKSKGEEFLTTGEVCKILGVCSKQLKKYRDDRRIAFTQLGRKIYIQRCDLLAFMEDYKIKRKSWKE